MRKIEQEMNRAIANLNAGESWKLDNTYVENTGDYTVVKLHGNVIAKLGDFWIQLFDGGFRSVTTKSRLNAILKENGIGESVYQKNFEWKLANPDGSIVDFESGMILS
jgi:hypothetical protein